MSKENKPFAQPQVEVIEGTIKTSAMPSQSSYQSDSASLSTPMDSLKELEAGNRTEDGFGAGVWYNTKKVTGIWTKAETRNSWLAISDLGWKKIYSGSDSAVVAMEILGAQALEKQSPVNVLIENDQIIEIYVW